MGSQTKRFLLICGNTPNELTWDAISGNLLVEGRKASRKKEEMEKEERYFLYQKREVQLAYERIFNYCGVKCPDWAEFDFDAWHKVLDCRHGDVELEALFAQLAEVQQLHRMAYNEMFE